MSETLSVSANVNIFMDQSLKLFKDLYRSENLPPPPKKQCEGLSNTFKVRKNVSQYFKRRHLIVYQYSVVLYCVDLRSSGFLNPRNVIKLQMKFS